MHKKMIMVLCGALIIAVGLAGCGKDGPQKYISLGNYKEVKIEGASTTEVTEEEIDQYIDEIRLRNAEEVQIENEPVRENDLVYIDFTAKVDGEKFEEISEENCMLTIGMGEIAEGLDQSVIGHFVGDHYEFNGKFSNDFYNVASYYNEDMAGEKATFEITVKSISRLKLPELNDEFVMNVSETSKTVGEYREEVEIFLQEDGMKEIDVKDAIWKEIVKETKVKKYPKEELETYIQRQERYYKKMSEDYGITYEELIETEMGSNKKEFKNRVQKEAKSKLKEQLIARAISEEENIDVKDTDDKLLEEAAWDKDYLDVKQLKESMSEEELNDIILLQRVKNWLFENCKIES